MNAVTPLIHDEDDTDEEYTSPLRPSWCMNVDLPDFGEPAHLYESFTNFADRTGAIGMALWGEEDAQPHVRELGRILSDLGDEGRKFLTLWWSKNREAIEARKAADAAAKAASDAIDLDNLQLRFMERVTELFPASQGCTLVNLLNCALKADYTGLDRAVRRLELSRTRLAPSEVSDKPPAKTSEDQNFWAPIFSETRDELDLLDRRDMALGAAKSLNRMLSSVIGPQPIAPPSDHVISTANAHAEYLVQLAQLLDSAAAHAREMK